ncbi:hypothetical protein [Achromobacter sp.]|uniref:hypothetical protein n=1 Tax=Achromobacter sp. TaxID=134375 RepID=UPI003C7326A1
MRSPWNEQAVLIDAEYASLFAPALPPETRLRCRHEGDPASAVAALLAMVRQRRPRWRNRLHVWLGYPWAQGQLLPWQPGMPGGDSHWRGYAQALLRERGMVGEWRVRLGAARHGRARLAVAADANLLDRLQRAVSESGWAMAGCRDLLSASLERYRRPLRQLGKCLVLAEAGAMTCVWQSPEGWDDMITLQLAPGQPPTSGVAAAEALCGRPIAAGYGWASTLSPQQSPAPPQARWLGFPHPMLGGQSCSG